MSRPDGGTDAEDVGVRVLARGRVMSIGEIFSELGRTRIYGSLKIKFEAGRVVLVKKTETIKPFELNHWDNRGESNDRNF